MHARQRIARHGAEQHTEEGCGYRLDQAVDATAHHRIFKDLDVVVEGHPARQPFDIHRHHIGRIFEGSRYHPDEWQGPENGDHHAHRPDEEVEPVETAFLQFAVEPAHYARSFSTKRCAMVTARISAKSRMAMAEA